MQAAALKRIEAESTPFIWTDKHVADLKKLHREGRSAAYIAREIGATSRSAVIGKVHRLGLSRDTQPNRGHHPKDEGPPVSNMLAGPGSPPKAPPAKTPPAAPPPAPVRPEEPDEVEGVGFFDLRPFHCKMPIDGEGLEAVYCGRRATRGSYCKTHGARVYVERGKVDKADLAMARKAAGL